MIHRPLIILATLCCFLHSGLCNSPDFSHIEVDRGLSNNDVNCCIQDSFGFMWFGTRDGLNRYDGNGFKVFKDYTDTSGKPGGNWINCLAIDRDGYLWLGTDLGVYRYNHIDATFNSLEFTQKLNVREFVFDGDNNLWMILAKSYFEVLRKIFSYAEVEKLSVPCSLIYHDESLYPAVNIFSYCICCAKAE
ncbi:MAG: hypothetical protein LBD21_07880, partial [Tannerellaceae bacterium]|nr:hypothetical protein [Tannerellaceae bacterium]